MRSILLFALALGAGDPLETARDAFVKGEFRKAIALARQLTDSNPAQAWRLIGASQCFLKEKPLEAYGKLDDGGKAFLRYVCSRNTVSLP